MIRVSVIEHRPIRIYTNTQTLQPQCPLVATRLRRGRRGSVCGGGVPLEGRTGLKISTGKQFTWALSCLHFCSVCVFVYVRSIPEYCDTRMIQYTTYLVYSWPLTTADSRLLLLLLLLHALYISTAMWRIVSHYTTPLSSFEIKTISSEMNSTY